MATVQQITIHPREIPPRRKFDEIPKSPFKRPFDPPRRVGDFPLPDPPPFRVDLSKPLKLKKRATENQSDLTNSQFTLKKAVQTYEADPEKVRARRQNPSTALKAGVSTSGISGMLTKSPGAGTPFSFKAFQSVQHSFKPETPSQLDLLA